MRNFQETILSVYKTQGSVWLKALPKFLNNLAEELQITVGSPFINLSYHYVAPAINQAGDTMVLKCGVPNPELTREIAALRFYAGRSVVKLIAYNSAQGWLLLERCQPGEVLTAIVDDDERTHIAMHTMQQLWHPCPADTTDFIQIETWLDGLKKFLVMKSLDVATQQQITYAIDVANDLLASMGEQVVLHGDLHHDNILRAQRQPWLVIDPKGIIGEREYEIGALLRNPLSLTFHHTDLKALFQRRIAIIIEMTGFDRERLLLWSFVQAVLSAGWCLEDGVPGVFEMMHMANTFHDLLWL